jgi:hypothetical protein
MVMAECDYLERASECLEMVQRAENSFHRTTLLEIASKWLLLAGDTPETRAVRDLVDAMKQPPER